MIDSVDPDIVLPISPLVRSFVETSFFTAASPSEPRSLLSPSQVLSRCDVKSPYIVVFEELKLVARHGDSDEVRLEEAMAMRAVWKVFPDGHVSCPGGIRIEGS